MQLNHLLNWAISCAFVCLLTVDFVTSLRDVRVKIPHAARRGEKVTLKCLYDLEGDSLYSVKWYKGRREFYSFTPKETPAIKVYQITGVRVERSASNESQLVLDSVTVSTTGKYSCEVSADAPSFHTEISAGELEVVEVPGKDPAISGIKSRYRVGDIVRGNCTSRHSKPAANLTWTINGRETNPSHIRHHKPMREARELETAVSGIHFVITPQHFSAGKLKIRCTAHIHDVYWKSTEKSIEEERHKHNINSVNTFSDDYFDSEDEQLIDRSDTYTTHIKGAVSSLNANGATQQHCHCLSLLVRWATVALAAWHATRYFHQLCRQLFVWRETMASKGTTMQAIRTTTTAATTTIVYNRTHARAKGQLLSGTSADEATSKAAVMTTQARNTTIATTRTAAAVAAMTACRSNWAVAVAQTKYRTRNETTSSQLIESINVQQQLERRQQQHRQQQQHIVGFEKRPATQKLALQLQKHSPKGAATLPTMRIAIKAKTAKTTATTNAAVAAKLLLAHATATAT
ncbi:uncharacterized protein LOC105232449 isoform X1 [Bactrocera dorsalis]|uniref:Uncharacterized protein LOC105232449 isoform X1 n=2 Tax=Bactrocera dorsalis TaxID=27457 RepID=A0ABM3J5U6_BACDO|nr:uncharacterized protein LOC105232449 isoform X1 [Bactrocera dorsalis]XP_049304595.1 uncharacterized protein LOC105232449 isoform X1 [Bactrocera dorsalis]XP_049304597.1 uncharacterized protein LOC105232449 isoform X1 [Bactrocera dorsalis]